MANRRSRSLPPAPAAFKGTMWRIEGENVGQDMLYVFSYLCCNGGNGFLHVRGGEREFIANCDQREFFNHLTYLREKPLQDLDLARIGKPISALLSSLLPPPFLFFPNPRFPLLFSLPSSCFFSSVSSNRCCEKTAPCRRERKRLRVTLYGA